MNKSVGRGTEHAACGPKAGPAETATRSGTDFTWPVRVYYEDTDFGGVVYHANYLKYLERGRTEWLRHLGFEQNVLRERHSIQFVVAGMQLVFHRPARFNDELAVSVMVSDIKRASLVFDQAISLASSSKQLLCSAVVRAACVDSVTFKPKPLPAQIVAEIQ